MGINFGSESEMPDLGPAVGGVNLNIDVVSPMVNRVMEVIFHKLVPEIEEREQLLGDVKNSMMEMISDLIQQVKNQMVVTGHTEVVVSGKVDEEKSRLEEAVNRVYSRFVGKEIEIGSGSQILS